MTDMSRMAARRPTLASLRDDLRRFAAARDWQQFHTPKNLAMALSVEAAELLECFQWLTPEQSARLAARDRHAVEEEVADVLLYLLRLTDVLGIDPLRAAQRKMTVNARKYPVALARGSARKYSRR
jgi:dCTP diphosphatase